MKNLKIYKKLNTRAAALLLSGTMFLTAFGLSGCNRKNNSEEEVIAPNPIVTTVDNTNNDLDLILPEASDEIIDNASIMLLLDLIAKKDENGKISTDLISEFKAKLDADNMINEFNSFLDMIQQKAIEGEFKEVSTVLPEELKNDKIILSNIESIVENIIEFYNKKDKKGLINEYSKIYTLFVEEKEIEMNGLTFEIRDLSYTSRAVATTYAEIANYYAKNYISEKEYNKMDKRTNDQNNKAYIKEILSILSNQMEEKSEVDVIKVFDGKGFIYFS